MEYAYQAYNEKVQLIVFIPSPSLAYIYILLQTYQDSLTSIIRGIKVSTGKEEQIHYDINLAFSKDCSIFNHAIKKVIFMFTCSLISIKIKLYIHSCFLKAGSEGISIPILPFCFPSLHWCSIYPELSSHGYLLLAELWQKITPSFLLRDHQINHGPTYP